MATSICVAVVMVPGDGLAPADMTGCAMAVVVLSPAGETVEPVDVTTEETPVTVSTVTVTTVIGSEGVPLILVMLVSTVDGATVVDAPAWMDGEPTALVVATVVGDTVESVVSVGVSTDETVLIVAGSGVDTMEMVGASMEEDVPTVVDATAELVDSVGAPTDEDVATAVVVCVDPVETAIPYRDMAPVK
jgi:hypothetical protein